MSGETIPAPVVVVVNTKNVVCLKRNSLTLTMQSAKLLRIISIPKPLRTPSGIFIDLCEIKNGTVLAMHRVRHCMSH